MSADIEKELKALAKKHGLEVFFSCEYCGHREETIGAPEEGISFFVTFMEKPQ